MYDAINEIFNERHSELYIEDTCSSPKQILYSELLNMYTEDACCSPNKYLKRKTPL